MTVSKRQLRALLESGVDPLEVARVFEVPLGKLLDKPAPRAEYTPSEDELAERARRLRWRAFDEAEDTFRNGTPAARQRLVASMLGREMRAATGVDLELAAMRVDFEGFLLGDRDESDVDGPDEEALP